MSKLQAIEQGRNIYQTCGQEKGQYITPCHFMQYRYCKSPTGHFEHQYGKRK